MTARPIPSGVAAPSRDQRLLAWIVPLLAIASVALWRSAPAEWAWWGSAGAVWTALVIGALRADLGRSALPATALIAAVATALRLPGEAWWPCDVVCAGGGAYQTLAGVPTLWLAIPAYLLWAALAALDARRGAVSADTALLSWALVGTSAFFLWTAWRLGMVCPHCLAVHGVVIAGAALIWRADGPWLRRLVAAALAFLVANLVFHHGPLIDVARPASGPEPSAPAIGGQGAPGAGSADAIGSFLGAVPRTTPGSSAPDDRADALRRGDAYRRADEGRRRGRRDAPYTFDLVMNLHCHTCAAIHGPLLRGLDPLIAPPGDGAASRLHLVNRLLNRATDPQAIELSRHALAAGLRGPERYAAFVATVAGSAHDQGFAELRSRIAEHDDPERIARLLADHADAIDQLLSDDADHFTATRTLRTPTLILWNTATRAEIRRWSGEIDPAAVVAEVVRLVGKRE